MIIDNLWIDCGNLLTIVNNYKYCKSCKSDYDRKRYLDNLIKRREQAAVYASNNKENKRNYDKNYRKINKDKVLSSKKERKASGKSYIEARRSSIKRKYNISLEDYDTMLNNQLGKCKICGATESNHKSSVLYIDHCHKTNKIRGLLCHHCNYGLGGFRDNIEYLNSAIEYLKENL